MGVAGLPWSVVGGVTERQISRGGNLSFALVTTKFRVSLYKAGLVAKSDGFYW